MFQGRDRIFSGTVTAPESRLRDVGVINSAAHASTGRSSVRAPHLGLQLADKVDCTLVPCFANPEGMGLSPFPGLLLSGLGTRRMQGSTPLEDFSGVRRRVPPATGAIERSSGPISIHVQP